MSVSVAYLGELGERREGGPARPERQCMRGASPKHRGDLSARGHPLDIPPSAMQARNSCFWLLAAKPLKGLLRLQIGSAPTLDALTSPLHGCLAIVALAALFLSGLRSTR